MAGSLAREAYLGRQVLPFHKTSNKFETNFKRETFLGGQQLILPCQTNLKTRMPDL